MFRELMPILEGRTLMLTLSRVDEAAIRVCIIPKRLKEATGETALCTPLTVTGTPEELDSDFAAQLSRYTGSLTKLGSNLAAIEAAHSAAVKAVEEEKKKDLDKKRGKFSGSKSTSGTADPKPGPAIKDGKPVFGAKNEAASAAPMTLFDAPAQESAATERPSADGPISAYGTEQQENGENPSPSEAEPPLRTKASCPGSSDSFQFSYPD